MEPPDHQGIGGILLLGDPRLYQVCDPVKQSELPLVGQWIDDLAAAMAAIRREYGFGRGIAAPQLGIMKRLFYIHIDQPRTVINPVIEYASPEMFTLWDDCMSFPNLLVKVQRHKAIRIRYRDENWEEQLWEAADAVSELLQHEYDHLDGILCTMRAVDQQAFRWRR